MSNGYRTPPSSPPGSPVARGGPLTINALKTILNRSGKNWAFTGSQAMKIHGNTIGRTHRAPNDIDILVNQLNLPIFIDLLSSIGYRLNGPPPLKRSNVNINKVTLNKGNKHIDLLVAGKLGPKFTTNSVHLVGGYPVVSIRNLITFKKRANGGNSAAANIAFLKSLLR